MLSLDAYRIGLLATLALVLLAWRIERGRWGRINDLVSDAIYEPFPRSMLAITGNWLLGLGFIALTGWTDCWLYNIVIDTAAAIAILWRPAGRAQAMLGVSYCVQIAMHTGYGAALLRYGSAEKFIYYDRLTTVAWAQLLIMGGWAIGTGVVAGYRRWRRAALRPSAPGARRVGAPR